MSVTGMHAITNNISIFLCVRGDNYREIWLFDGNKRFVLSHFLPFATSKIVIPSSPVKVGSGWCFLHSLTQQPGTSGKQFTNYSARECYYIHHTSSPRITELLTPPRTLTMTKYTVTNIVFFIDFYYYLYSLFKTKILYKYIHFKKHSVPCKIGKNLIIHIENILKYFQCLILFTLSSLDVYADWPA